MHEVPVDTSRQAHVVLDIGGDDGALVIVTPPDLDGAEIELSPAAQPHLRTHAEVHPRFLAQRVLHAAVFPTLSAGRYTVWLPSMLPAMPPSTDVVISGGNVTELSWL